MGWKLIKTADCRNQVGVEKVKLKNMTSGTYLFQFTGKFWINREEDSSFPTFTILREEDGQVMGESTVTCPPNLSDEIKNSAVKFAEQYKVSVEDGVIAIIPR